jgi:hypothetical protein
VSPVRYEQGFISQKTAFFNIYLVFSIVCSFGCNFEWIRNVVFVIEGKQMGVLKNRVLEPQGMRLTGVWIIMRNEERHNLHSSTDIKIIRSR